MDYLPKDPSILVSSVNMLLRDEEFDTLESLCYAFNKEPRDIKDYVYIHSTLDWQKDDIEYAIGCYVDDMSQELYEAISDGRDDFLRDHKRFGEDISLAVDRLDRML